jgi:iron complex outermembrane recepter protein
MSAFVPVDLTERLTRRQVRISMLATAALCGSMSMLAHAQTREERPVEEVIVTAQKRAERLQDVPISISVLNGASLDRSVDKGVAEALNRVPGVISSVGTAGARSNRIDSIVVRGVSPSAGSSATAYYLDSSPFGFVRFGYAPDSSAYDMQRVEVLRGPQSTLYGASALNGVVRVLTNDAHLDKLELKARSGISTTEDGGQSYRQDIAVNVPLIEEKLAVRAVAGYQDLSGWIDKPFKKDVNDAEIGNYRLKVNAQPTEQFSIGLSGWLSRSDFGSPSVSADGRRSPFLFEEPSSTDYDVYSLSMGYEFPAFSVTSTTSYVDFALKSAVDFSPASAPNIFLNTITKSRVSAEELLINSKSSGPWIWSVGAFYRDAWERNFQTRTNPLTGALTSTYFAPLSSETASESFAIFGQLTWALLDGQIELTGGLRYFEDEISDQEKSRNTVVGGIPPAGLTSDVNKFDDVSPRFVVTWHASDDTTLYASYAEGFRSGLNQFASVAAIAPEYRPADPDHLKNYELGAKGSLWDSRFSFDTAVFFIDWQGVQQQLQVPVAPGQISAALVNAESVSGLGFEFALTVQPVRGMTLGANFSWNELEVDHTVLTNGRVLYPEGVRLLRSPEYTAGISADYTFSLGSGFDGHFSAAVNYIPEQFTDRTSPTATVPTRTFESDSVLMSRASFGINSPGSWKASVFVDNLTDENAVTARDQFGPVWYTRPRPRTVGMQLEFSF